MRTRRFASAAVLALLGSAVLVVRFSGNAAGGADSSGYLNSARLLAHGRLSEPVRTVPGVVASTYPAGLLVPLGMRPGRAPLTAVPVYPVGLPLHLAAASLLVGLGHAPAAVNALAWVAALALLYRLARRLALPPGWGVASVAAFALFPVTVLQAVRPMSDLLATTWCLAAVTAAVASRSGRRWALAAGFSLAVAVLVRPTDVLVAPAVALAIGADLGSLGLAAAGAAPVLAGLGLYNTAVYGHALATGYTGELGAVSLANLGSGLVHYGRWLGTFLGAPAAVLLAVALVRAVRGDRRQAVLLAWGGALLGFYALYGGSLQGWWRLRFVLPALPAIILSAAIAGRDLAQRAQAGRARGRVWVALGLAACLGWDLASSAYWVVTRRLWNVGASEDVYPLAIAWAEGRVPANAALMAMQTSGAVYFYGRLPIVRYDLLGDRDYARFLADARAAGVPLYALLFRIDRLEFERRWPTDWQRVGGLEEASLWRLRDETMSVRPP